MEGGKYISVPLEPAKIYKFKVGNYFATKHLYYLNITYVLTYLLNVFDSVPNFAVNMSLGLTMIADPTTQNTMVS